MPLWRSNSVGDISVGRPQVAQLHTMVRRSSR